MNGNSRQSTGAHARPGLMSLRRPAYQAYWFYTKKVRLPIGGGRGQRQSDRVPLALRTVQAISGCRVENDNFAGGAVAKARASAEQR